MCDVEKINKYTEELFEMDLSDFRQLIVEAKTEELREYYTNIYDFFLQKRQKEVLKEHVF